MIYLVARSAEAAEKFITTAPQLRGRCTAFVQPTSYFEVLRWVIQELPGPVACVIHADVRVGHRFLSLLEQLVLELERHWPNWGLVGNVGITSFGTGFSASNVVRYLHDESHGINLTNAILPAQTIGGSVLLLNVSAMRQRGLKMPAGEGFELYDLLLSIETVQAGLSVLVAPHLACWQTGIDRDNERTQALRAPPVKTVLSRLRKHEIETLWGTIPIEHPEDPIGKKRLDLDRSSIGVAAKGRPTKTVAIVIRTQFRRPEMLRRTLWTVRAFIAAAADSAKFECHVVTDSAARAPDFVTDFASIVSLEEPNAGDTRCLLIFHAIANIVADYFWFVDDDDWLFPNEASTLADIINIAPERSIILVASQHFHEGDLPNGGAYPPSAGGHYFTPKLFMKSLSGNNNVPFCSAIFNRRFLLSVPPEISTFVTYAEDHTLLLLALVDPICFPIVFDALFAGISVREGTSITQKDRSIWHQSYGEIASLLANSEFGQFISLCGIIAEADEVSRLRLESKLKQGHIENLERHVERVEHEIAVVRQGLKEIESSNKLKQGHIENLERHVERVEHEIAVVRQGLKEIESSRSWKLTRPLRGASRLSRSVIDVVRSFASKGE